MEHVLEVNWFDVPCELVDDARCGNGTQSVFRCKVRVGADKLDKDGFVCEVLDFMESLRGRFAQRMLKASCEELCSAVVNHACLLVGDRLTRVEADVQNRTGMVAGVWKRGDTLPEFPREATKLEKERTCKARKSCRDKPLGC